MKPLSVLEQQRLIEIQFYLFIKHLYKTYNRSAIIGGILESFSKTFGCNVSTIRYLVNEIDFERSSIIPEKEELAVILYRSGMSIRLIRRVTSMHPQTLYRHFTAYKEAGQFECAPRLDDETFAQVKKFMEHLVHLSEAVGWL